MVFDARPVDRSSTPKPTEFQGHINQRLAHGVTQTVIRVTLIIKIEPGFF